MSGAVVPTVIVIVVMVTVVRRPREIPVVVALLTRRAVAAMPPPAPSAPPAGPPLRSLRPARLRRAPRPVFQMHSMSSGVALSISLATFHDPRRSVHMPAAGPPPEVRGGGTVAAFEKAAR